ncbi:translocator protein [Coniella lustricola]|uniref:Translocator protein n=1 Tax=Coniella lustricola TaxID=2025994 RepID=A0A2T3AML3_9PEZI|nr:translocator protein [Coniella lustricola]
MTTFIPAITIPYGVFASPAASMLLPISLGGIIGYSTRPKKNQSQEPVSIKQPPLRPPPWVFGPAWTLLYGLMGYAAHRAITAGLSPLTSTPALIRSTKHSATLYSIQLALNLAWMPLFFGAKRPIEASVDILALLGTNLYITNLWWSIDRTASYLMVPYLGWLSFATYLCVGAGYLNGWDFRGKELRSKQE